MDSYYESTDNPLWVVRHNPRPSTKMRLFCFPYAGGGPSIYRVWSEEVRPEIEICAVHLPGRENRLTEAPIREMGELVSQLEAPLQVWMDQPYAFFGHSFGALLAYEVARHQFRRKKRLPEFLFVSGCDAPQIRTAGELCKLRHQLPDNELLDELRRIDGTSAGIINNRELMAALLPIIRADLEVVENYNYQTGPALTCPLTAFGATDDTFTTRRGLEAWRDHTTENFECRIFPGNHFFLNSQRRMVLNYIARELK